MEYIEQLKRAIRAADDAFFYSMRTFDDLIERDETIERLQGELRKALRMERALGAGIRARRRELRRY